MPTTLRDRCHDCLTAVAMRLHLKWHRLNHSPDGGVQRVQYERDGCTVVPTYMAAKRTTRSRWPPVPDGSQGQGAAVE